MASNTKCSNLTQLAVLLHIEFYNSFLIGRRCTVNFRSQCQWCHNCRLYNNHLKDTRGEGIQSKLLWQQWLSRSKPTGAIYSVPPLLDFSIYRMEWYGFIRHQSTKIDRSCTQLRSTWMWRNPLNMWLSKGVMIKKNSTISRLVNHWVYYG